MLNAKEIRQLIESQKLITNYVDLEEQVQPTGFDLSLRQVRAYLGCGGVDFSNEERVIASTDHVEPDGDGWYNLPKGCYQIVYNEIISMPLDIVAIAKSRSTMLRNGAAVDTAIWDPGYRGRSSSLLVVHNPHGIRLKRNARVAQLIFYRTLKVRDGYTGIYKNERMQKEE